MRKQNWRHETWNGQLWGWAVEGRGKGWSKHMYDMWTWTTERGLTAGQRSGLGGGGQKGKNWDSSNRINNKT